MTKRWQAVVYYRSENGLVDVTHEIEELGELEHLVEAGPDWNAIDEIEIRLLRPSHFGLTVEEAERL